MNSARCSILLLLWIAPLAVADKDDDARIEAEEDDRAQRLGGFGKQGLVDIDGDHGHSGIQQLAADLPPDPSGSAGDDCQPFFCNPLNLLRALIGDVTGPDPGDRPPGNASGDI